MAQNAVDYPQATIAEHFGEADYLRVLTEESDATPEKGQPTDKLVDATVRSIPGMVTVNFTIYERPMASPTASTRSRVQAPKGVCC